RGRGRYSNARACGGGSWLALLLARPALWRKLHEANGLIMAVHAEWNRTSIGSLADHVVLAQPASAIEADRSVRMADGRRNRGLRRGSQAHHLLGRGHARRAGRGIDSNHHSW